MTNTKIEKTTVVIANTAESFKDYFVEEDLVRSMPFVHMLGDRVSLWKGGAKIAVTTLQIPSIGYWQNILHLDKLVNIYPNQYTACLSIDILNDKVAFNNLIAECERSESVELIPYHSTDEFWALADQIKMRLKEKNISVTLPESPDKNNAYLWKYLNTKTGFRHKMGEWFGKDLPIEMPEGYFANNFEEATEIIDSFLRKGKNCICKSYISVSGVGHVRFEMSNRPESLQAIKSILQSAPYMQFFPLVIEEFIKSNISPSSESIIVSGSGEILKYYNCSQIFSEDGFFNGVYIGKGIIDRIVEEKIDYCAQLIGKKLKQYGYLGIFDLDFIVDPSNNKPYILEANLRRTGGTHVHESAVRLLGENYLDKRCVFSGHDLGLNKPLNFHELLARIEPVLFPMGNREEGIIITKASSLPSAFGYIVFGVSSDRIRAIQKKMIEILN